MLLLKKIRSMKYLEACLTMINTLLRMHMCNSTSVTSVYEIPRYSAAVILRAELRKRGQKGLQAVPSLRRLSQPPVVTSQSSSTQCLWLIALKGPLPTQFTAQCGPCPLALSNGTGSAGKALPWEASLAGERVLQLTEIQVIADIT